MFPSPVAASAPPRPYTVSELLSEVGLALKTSWRDVAVVGEIGRFDLRSGHGYFTLKDRGGSINAVIFASDLRRVPFRPEPGLEVVARGALDLWAPQGRFQLKAWSLEPVGAGALQLALEQLKAKLAAEGLFDKARKRAIPMLPQRIAVVTSPKGAAIRDILSVLRRRFDGLAVTVYPVRVQGELAAGEIAQGIRACSEHGGFDVLIVARGGGSFEDLAPFNDERVARALAICAIPTISAVGHETDVTICDLAADLRAATPSAAAELVVERKDGLARRVSDIRRRCERAVLSRLRLTRARLTALSRAEGLLRFRYRLREWRERLAQAQTALVDELARRPEREAARLAAVRRALMGFSRVARLSEKRAQVSHLSHLLEARTRRALERRGERVRAAAAKLDALSPLAVLSRGYAVAWKAGAKRPLLSAAEARAGDRIRVRLHEGELGAIVRETSAALDHGPLFHEEPATTPPLFPDEEDR
ncbi:MAG: exodeoxyribonuclease VII large subunit [Thermoanaerobaculia bacterium]